MNLSEKAKVLLVFSDKFFEGNCGSAQHGAGVFILYNTKGGMKHGKFSY
jgi:hypothetical protein